MRVLLTGGTGFIGSHQAVALLEAGHEVHLVDDLSNSRADVVGRVAELTGQIPEFTQADVADPTRITNIIESWSPDALMHFAAHKHVWESVEKPTQYYTNNLGCLAALMAAVESTSLRNVVFSSSGSIYGNTNALPLVETTPANPSNPYSATKAIGERMLQDLCAKVADLRVVALRYFNPAGAHPSGLLGEEPSDRPTNLVPAIMRVAAGEVAELEVFGSDLPTPDGTCIRDYVHVMDVADAHLRALDRPSDTGFVALNIGRGVGVSVAEMVTAAERVLGSALPVRHSPRRPGDVPALYADTSQATALLGLGQLRGIDEVLSDAWNWEKNRPHRADER